MSSLRVALLAILTSMLASPVHAQGASERPAIGVAVVLAARLNLRSAPSLEGAVVGSIHRGDSVCVAGREADWLRVRRRDSRLPETAAADSTETSAASEEVFAARGFLSETRLGPDELRRIGC